MTRLSGVGTLILVMGCLPETVAHSDDEDMTGSSTDTGGAGTDGDSSLPMECLAGNPFQSAECGRALKETCRRLQSEEECTAQGPFSFDEQYTFLCGWAKVVVFADTEACTVETVQWRCEAGISQSVGCSDPCDGKAQDIYKSLNAIESEAALLQMPCGPDNSVLDGPIGEWTQISNDETYAHACGADTPPPPRLCDCTPIACEAE